MTAADGEQEGALMFCMRCGAEARGSADVCAVCGESLSGQSRGAYALRPANASSAVVETSAQEPSPTPSISYGDLDSIRLPRDLTGRVLLATLLALLVDLVIPWMRAGALSYAPESSPGIALLMLVLLTSAAATLLYVPLQQRPLLVALPMSLGVFCLGAGCGTWGLLAMLHISSPDLGSYPPLLGGGGGGAASPVPVGSIQLLAGYYLFLLCAAVLTLAGYAHFRARETERVEYSAEHSEVGKDE